MRDDPSDQPKPSQPKPLGPRQMRAQLSSSLGLGPEGRREPVRVEPRLGERADDAAAPVVAVEVRAVEAAPAVRRVADQPVPGPPPGEPPRRASQPRTGEAPRGRAERPPAEASAVAARREPARPEPPLASSKTIVPPQAVAGRALVSVVAIMCFLACLAVGTLSLVIGAAHDWQIDVSREVTIQVKPVDGAAMASRLATALEIARATTGVRSARLIDERESAALLEPWLGQGLDLSSLPVPRLVVLDLADPASADLAGLKRRIAAEVAGAVVDDHAVWAARLRTMAGAVVAVGVMVVLLVFAAMVLSVVFATQSAMAGNRDVIEVLHFVGAEDSFIARQFQRHFLKLGLIGGLAGGAVAIVGFVFADVATRTGRGDALADQAHALFGGFSVGLGGHLGVVVVVGVVAGLTAITSRATVLGHLRRLD